MAAASRPYRFSAATGAPLAASSGMDTAACSPIPTATLTKPGQDMVAATSGTTTGEPSSSASMQGPDPSAYWASSTARAISLLAATVVYPPPRSTVIDA